IEQYRTYLVGLYHGNLGVSFRDQQPVSASIRSRYPATIELTVAALIFSILFAVPAGVISAIRKGRFADRGFGLLSLLGVSLPNFALGPLLILFFSIFLGLLPVSGRDGVLHLILPAATLGAGLAAMTMRMVRSS